MLAEAGPAAVAPARELVPPSLAGLLAQEQEGMRAARAALEHASAGNRLSVPLKGTRLEALLPRPNSIRDFMVVEQHVRRSDLPVPEEWFEIPVYYKGNADAVFGPADEIRWPEYTEKLDYELELAIVIGRRGRPCRRGAGLHRRLHAV